LICFGIFVIDDKIFGGWCKVDKFWFDLNKGCMVMIECNVGGLIFG